MTFDDNRLLPALFGEQNSHLRDIEKAFNVQIHSRGNQIAILGRRSDTQQARQILNILWDKLRKGADVDGQTVDAALRFSIADKENKVSIAPTNLKNFAETKINIAVRKKTIAPRSPVRATYREPMQKHQPVFGIGPAGTGKTYLAVAHAVALFEQERIERIILSRPAVEAGENLGFLPGDLKEKIDPYLRPLYDALYDTLPGEQAMKGLESGEIEVAPLAFMRGRTLANSFVILDEAQNCTPVQMKMFLTRLGENSRMAITGDPSQVDLPLGAKSGLRDALDILDGVPGVATVHFSDADVVRHPLVTRIVKAYNARERDLLGDKGK